MALRSILLATAFAAAATAAASSASATQLLFDNFDDPIGPLDGRGGGTGWSGNWTGADVYSVAAGSLTYSNLSQSGNRAQFVPTSLAGTGISRSIATFGTPGSTFWLSFLESFDGKLAQNSADVRLDAGNGYLRIGSPTDLNNPAFWGLEDTASETKVLSSTAIVPGSALFVAIKIELNPNPDLNDKVTVYFEPNTATTDGDAPGVPGVVLTDLNFRSSNIGLALEGNAFPNPVDTHFVANFDPIRGGTTYFDVAPANIGAVPEPGTWLLTLAGFGALGEALRRSRTAPPGSESTPFR